MKQSVSEHLSIRAEELISAGRSGVAAGLELSDVVDRLLIAAFEELMEGGPAPRPLALVAVGGYGRREMAPYSDVDIMLLAKARDSGTTEAAQAVLYRLWDMGLNISHSFRTPSECAEDSAADLKTRTTLIEARFLAGDRRLFDGFTTDIHPKILFKGKRDFVGSLLRDIDTRHKAYGDSIYLLEPNIKEGRGGLRDVHSLSWLVKVVLRLTGQENLKRIMPANDYLHLTKAYDFLLRARIGLHAISKRKNDVLSFEFQDAAAALLGFKATKRFSAAEILMRLYYKKAGNITKALTTVMNLCGRRYIQFPIDFTIRKINADFSLSKSEIIIKNKELLKNTDKILEAFALSSSIGKKLSYRLKEAIRSRFLFINKQTRTSRKAVLHFLDILKGKRVYKTLRDMHDTGVLDRFIPEFGSLRHLVISEPYHRYTVDEHSLIAIRNIETLRDVRQGKFDYLAAVLKDVKQDVLFLALLLHDIGKGVSKRHEEAGYRLLKGIMERFAVAQADRSRIEFLVKNHIVLSRLALTRDTDAPETIAQLAETVENVENLDALYLMTYADMTAVHPHFWTEWKAYLFHDLYKKTKEHLQGMKGRYITVQDKKLKKFVEQMPARYLISTTNDIITADYRLAERARRERVAVAITEKEDNTAEIVVVTNDTHGLFATLAGVMSSKGFNILKARLYTGTSGLVIDKIVVSNWKEAWWTGIEEQLINELRSAIVRRSGNVFDKRGASPIFHHQREDAFFRFESFAEIDNETSDIATILELFLPDRFGLLRDIAAFLSSHGIDILSAVINTEEGVAQDVFYLQYKGGKVADDMMFDIVQSLQRVGEWGGRIRS